jgi:nitrogen regulation protein NR(I)
MALNLPEILVVDDEESMRFLMREVMSREGYHVSEAADGETALEMVRANQFHLVILDVKMPGMDGIQALKEIRRLRPHLLVIMMTAHGNNSVALQAMREGAYDYFNKPFELDEMRIVIRRALEKQTLLTQIADLKEKLGQRTKFDRIIGSSDSMQRVFAMLEKVVETDVTVLITGESGTGKELVAQAVHYQSVRRHKPFISINCAAIPENLLESELFGHERGSFTGATSTRVGQFEAANGGSIFLDEIGDMPLSLQSKLLRVLQERQVVRVGGSRPISVDIRVIAATNQDLHLAVQEKRFREDLFFRLNVLPISLPPLRNRVADIPMLIQHFLAKHNPRLNKNIVGLTPESLEVFLHYPWPGNIRELENVVQHSMVMASGTLLNKEELPGNVLNHTPMGGGFLEQSCGTSLPVEVLNDFSVPLAKKLESVQDEIERRIIVSALDKANHHRQATADLLGISRKSLHNKMVRYHLFGEKDGTGTDGGV